MHHIKKLQPEFLILSLKFQTLQFYNPKKKKTFQKKKIRSIFNENTDHFFEFRKIRSKNIDQFCLEKKSDMYLMKIPINSVFRIKIKFVFNENADQFCVLNKNKI